MANPLQLLTALQMAIVFQAVLMLVQLPFRNIAGGALALMIVAAAAALLLP